MIDKNKNNWGINLCDDCKNAMRYNEETHMDTYSFKRKGQVYDRHAYCTKNGKIIGLHKVVKCTHYDAILVKK